VIRLILASVAASQASIRASAPPKPLDRNIYAPREGFAMTDSRTEVARLLFSACRHFGRVNVRFAPKSGSGRGLSLRSACSQ